MTDMIQSMIRFSWAMSLFGVRQATEMLQALGTARSPRPATDSFDAVSRAAEAQFAEGLADTYRTETVSEKVPEPGRDASGPPAAGELDEPGDDALDEKVLGALAISDASRKDLEKQLGVDPGPLRQSLNRLIASGHIQRKGKGMRTRYHRVEL